MTSLAPANLRDRTLLILGAGYVGGEVARQAAEAGLQVTAVTRNPLRASALRAAGTRVILADMATADWHAAVPNAPDFVLNCVASGGGGLAGYKRSYVDGMRSVLDWAGGVRKNGHLVYTGSTSVYPQGEGALVDENASTVPASEDEPAGLLRMAEDLVGHWPGPRTVLRLAGIYGPGRHHLLDQLRAAPSELPGAGDHHLNLIHRDDIRAAIWRAWETGATGTFNVSDGAAATRAEVVGWLARQLRVPVPRFTGEAAAGRRRVTPDRIISNNQARSRLGWNPAYPDYRHGYRPLLTTTL